MEPKANDNSPIRLRRILFVLGAIFAIGGFARQWPVLGGTYMQFIEGPGYLSLIMGLVMIVLGFSVPLLFPDNGGES